MTPANVATGAATRPQSIRIEHQAGRMAEAADAVTMTVPFAEYFELLTDRAIRIAPRRRLPSLPLPSADQSL